LNYLLSTLEINDLTASLSSITLLQLEIQSLSESVESLSSDLSQKQQQYDDLLLLKQQLEQTIQEKNEEIDRLTSQYDSERNSLLSSADNETSHLKGKFNAVLKQMKSKNDEMEVKLCLYERILPTVLSNYCDSLVDEKSLLTEEMKQSHQQAIQNLHQQYQKNPLTSTSSSSSSSIGIGNDKIKKRLATLEDENNRLEVKLLLFSMVNKVADKNPFSSKNTTGDQGQGDGALQQELFLMQQQLSEAKQQLNEKYSEIQQLKSSSSSSTAPAVITTKPVLIVDPRIEELQKQISFLSSSLSQHDMKLNALAKECELVRNDRDSIKLAIKEWTTKFVEENGREPEVADKAMIRDKYQSYKLTSLKTKECEGQLVTLEKEKDNMISQLQLLEEELQQRISAVAAANAAAVAEQAPVSTSSFSTTPSSSAAAVNIPAVSRQPMVDVEIQVIPHELRAGGLAKSSIQNSKNIEEAAASAAIAGEGEKKPIEVKKEMADITKEEFDELQRIQQESIEGLEDQLYSLKEEIEKLKVENSKMEIDRSLLTNEVDALIKEKRTDVIKRYEEDTEKMKQKEIELEEKVTILNTEKIKLETRVNELRDRAERAELELKDRDTIETAKLNTNDEKFQLKNQINKQRDQIIMKAKAATAGWDAAASADEKVEIEIQKAYQRGLKEEKEKHKNDLDSIHSSLEIKETRITELLVDVAEMQRKVVTVDSEKKEMLQQIESLKLEVADAITGIQSIAMAGSGGGGTVGEDGEIVIPPSQMELDSAREQLDLAQEELVNLMERCDKLEAEVEIARRKNRIFERLSNLTGLTAGKAASVSGGGSGGGGVGSGGGMLSTDYSRYDIDTLINSIKRAITKGTNLWKSNRKDECYDVYLDVCIEATQRLYTEELVKPVRDAVENGKVLGAANKQRGAVVFRKALDKLLTDTAQPTIRKNEEDAVANLKARQAATIEEQDGNNNEMVSDLMIQLENLENSFLEQGYTKDKNPSNSNSTGEAKASPRAGMNNNENDGDGVSGSSLLQRAKVAESQVVSLRKQLAAVLSATAANNNNNINQTGPMGGGDVGKRPGTTSQGRQIVAKAVVASAQSGSSSMDAAEARRLNRKIKELEDKLKKANESGGSGGGAGGSAGAAEIKAMQLAEKQLQKKLKDQETALKRESKQIEMRAVKAENALSKIQGTYNAITQERDTLKSENAKLFTMTSEIGTLKAKSEKCDQVEAQLTAKEEELKLLQEQFKKESTLRKKYKNDLEDLKGAIRVYARCRPMAKYELEKGN
jgi:chromosome segregation ATPase